LERLPGTLCKISLMREDAEQAAANTSSEQNQTGSEDNHEQQF
jgi:hypothetical protein